jgi:hypothetical protein
VKLKSAETGSASRQQSARPGSQPRRAARYAAIGIMSVSALFMFVAPASATTSQHTLDARAQIPRGIFPPAPDCGNSVSLQSVKYAFDTYSFKIVGSGLDEWLGGGSGFLAYQAGVVNQAEPYESGEVNATGTGGARTGVISLHPVTVNQELDIQVEIRYTRYGTDLCQVIFNPRAVA